MSQSGAPNPTTTAAALDPSREAALPVEPASRSEILRASHVFSVEIVSVDASPWAPKPDGAQARSLDMKAKLLEPLKGELATAAGAVFDLSVEQVQGSPRLPPVGIWSSLEPEPKVRYLFVSNGLPASTAGALMAQGAVVRVSDGESAADVHLAREGERVFRTALQDPANVGKDPELAASRALIELARREVEEAGDIFARYLLARISPSFVRSPDRPVSLLCDLLVAPKATFGLRAEVAALLDQVAVELGADPVFLRAVADAYLRLLVDPGAQRLHHRLVNVSLYLLVFPKEGSPARATAASLIPDETARARYGAALSAFQGERAEKLSAWLAGAAR